LSWSSWPQAMSGDCSSTDRPFWKAPGVTTTTAILSVILMAFGSLMIASGPLGAHTRVWVTMKCELRYDPDGSMIEVRHAWTFDDVFFSRCDTWARNQETRGVQPRGSGAAG
jgi:hypothetical protein